VAELSGFEVLALLKEIGSTLRGTYVNNIFSIGTSQLLRLRKSEAPDVWLVISPKKGVWVSENVEQRGETTAFTTKLRAELERAKFAGATQIGLDRVFELRFELDEGRKLLVELMPPGNIIVTDSDGRIILSQEEVRSKARRIVKGERYQPPRQTRLSPLDIKAEDVKAMLGVETTAGKAIGKHIALPRKYVSVSLARLGMADDSPSAELAGREEEVAKVISGMVAEARDNPRPCLCKTETGDDIYVIPPTGVDVIEVAKSVSELCDRVFLREAEGAAPPSQGEGKRRELEITISKLRAESEALLAAASKARDAAPAASTRSVGDALGLFKESGAPSAKELTSSAAVASALFDYAKRLEQKSSENLEAARRLEKRLARVEPGKTPQSKPLPKRRQEWFEKFRWFVTSGGRLALGGRDAQTNTILVKRHLEDGDVVYHADLFGSPFFILKDGRQQSELEILELSQATVSFSSGWKTGLGAADAFWVFKDQVSTAAETGEYLAKGSFVIRGKKNFTRHAMLQVAVGLDEGGRVMAGPESAIAKACPRYVVLVPHREKSSDTAKKVLKELALPNDAAKAPRLDDVLRALPSGGGKIVRRKSQGDVRDKP
jgi:predicted ribosome quality control (RQC) complex YloA/Tae2 family protein